MTSFRFIYRLRRIVFNHIITLKTMRHCDIKPFKCRTIVFTKFNHEDAQVFLQELKTHCDWVLGQEEMCPETGKVHIQGMAYSKQDCRWGFVKEHKEKCRDPTASIAYCSKEESRLAGPWEYGIRPTFNVKGMKEKNAQMIQGDIKELVDEGRVSLLSIKRIIEARTIYANLKPIVEEPKVIKGTWHYGEPRTGKSTAARTGVYYLKSANKWWDGYAGEDKVVLEDVDPHMKDWLSYFIKIWTDWWHFKAEIKGGHITIQIKEFHVTSNYSLTEVFGEDAAIISRFKSIHYSDPFHLNK